MDVLACPQRGSIMASGGVYEESRYIYCANNPVANIDPSGEDWLDYAAWLTYSMWFQFNRFYLQEIHLNYSNPWIPTTVNVWETRCMSGLEWARTDPPYVPNEGSTNAGPIPENSALNGSSNYYLPYVRYTDNSEEFAGQYGTSPWVNWHFRVYDLKDGDRWVTLLYPWSAYCWTWQGGRRGDFAVHCGTHPNHDYRSNGCLKMRPDRMAAVTFLWDRIAGSTAYGPGVYSNPWLWCGGPDYDANNSNNWTGWMQQWTAGGGYWTGLWTW